MARVDLEVRGIRFEMPCANCDAVFPWSPWHTTPSAFCSWRCSDIARAVRYGRGLVARFGSNPKAWGVDRWIALQQKAYAASMGGFPPTPKAARAAVLERDGGICVACGAPGTEVDHMNGDSHALEDLRLLCTSCNQLWEVGGRVTVGRIADRSVVDDIRRRVFSPEPERDCDARGQWRSKRWTTLHQVVIEGDVVSVVTAGL